MLKIYPHNTQFLTLNKYQFNRPYLKLKYDSESLFQGIVDSRGADQITETEFKNALNQLVGHKVNTLLYL